MIFYQRNNSPEEHAKLEGEKVEDQWHTRNYVVKYAPHIEGVEKIMN